MKESGPCVAPVNVLLVAVGRVTYQLLFGRLGLACAVFVWTLFINSTTVIACQTNP